MKNLLRVLAISMFLTTFGVVAGFAQGEEKCPDLAACFEIFKTELKKDCGMRDKAIEIGKYIGEKFKDDEQNKELVDKIRARAIKEEADGKICKRNNAYNDAFKAKNWDNFFAVGKEIINDPSTEKGLALDVMLDLISVGLNNAAEKNDKFNNETTMYSKTALQSLQNNIASKTGKYGVWIPFNNKENSVSWSNYTIGYILYDRQGNKEEAIPYFYKATQIGEKKNDTLLYIRIGYWYGDKATALYDEYSKLRESANAATDEETKTKLNNDANAKLALARGYAERAMDAFARGLKTTNKDTKPEVVKGLNDEITKYYKFRFNGKEQGQTEFVSALIAKPMPDPSTAVTPVVEETTPTTTTTSTTDVKPTSTVKTASTTETSAKTTNVSTTAKTTAKKPVVKKKANR